jgi:hypothetical protein
MTIALARLQQRRREAQRNLAAAEAFGDAHAHAAASIELARVEALLQGASS